MKAFHFKTVLAVTMAVFILSCAGSLKGSKEEKLAYFDQLEEETLARLIKEYPQSEQELVEGPSTFRNMKAQVSHERISPQQVIRVR